MSKTRVFYFSPNIYENYRNINGEFFSSSPGGNKVAGVVGALGLYHPAVWTVSAPVVSSGVKRFYQKRIIKGGRGWASVYFPAFRNRWINRTTAFFSYFWFCLWYVSSNDKVIFYNFFPEYVPAAIILKIKGCAGILDIEDSPRKNESLGWFELLNRYSFVVLRKLSDKRLIAASNWISNEYGQGNSFVCHGVNRFTRNPLSDFSTIIVLFSGAKTIEWGNEVFIDAIKALALWPIELRKKIKFYVTGFGDFERIRQCEQKFHEALDIIIIENATSAEYKNILLKANVGLELRIPESEGAQTTFPSKLVELATSGLLVITTGSGDISSVLPKDAAIFISKPYAKSLSDALLNIVNNPVQCVEISNRGYSAMSNCSDPSHIGLVLNNFLL